MTTTAIILTVYNRREITLRGLRSLYRAIEVIGENYAFDIYMTDDGCSDGTAEDVAEEFPQIRIVRGNGNLYWSGGMRMAWQVAIDSGIEYEYYLWYNDDAELYRNSLQNMFKASIASKNEAIISGAFCDHSGNVSYGGRTNKWDLITPQNNEFQSIKYMNGNLVLIPNPIFEKLGMIDEIFVHGIGDYDYGLRALKHGFKVLLTNQYVGITDRHDHVIIPPFCKKLTLCQRFKKLYSPQFSPIIKFKFTKRHFGLLRAVVVFAKNNIYALMPNLKENKAP